MTSFLDFCLRKIPLFDHCNVIFCQNFLKIDIDITEIKGFLRFSNNFSLFPQIKKYSVLKIVRSKTHLPWPFCLSISSVTCLYKWKRIIINTVVSGEVHGSWEAPFTMHLDECALGWIVPSPTIYNKEYNQDKSKLFDSFPFFSWGHKLHFHCSLPQKILIVQYISNKPIFSKDIVL